MIEIDRIALIVRPRLEMLQWLHSLDETLKELTHEDLYMDCTVLLLPFCEDEDELREIMESQYLEVFTNELAAWCEDETLWPQQLTFRLFTQWFDMEVHHLVADLTDDTSSYGYN